MGRLTVVVFLVALQVSSCCGGKKLRSATANDETANESGNVSMSALWTAILHNQRELSDLRAHLMITTYNYTLHDKLAVYESSMVPLHKDIYEQRGAIAVLQVRVDSLDKKVDVLDEKVDSVRQQLDETTTALSEQLDEKTTALSRKLDDKMNGQAEQNALALVGILVAIYGLQDLSIFVRRGAMATAAVALARVMYLWIAPSVLASRN